MEVRRQLAKISSLLPPHGGLGARTHMVILGCKHLYLLFYLSNAISSRCCEARNIGVYVKLAVCYDLEEHSPTALVLKLVLRMELFVVKHWDEV